MGGWETPFSLHSSSLLANRGVINSVSKFTTHLLTTQLTFIYVLTIYMHITYLVITYCPTYLSTYLPPYWTFLFIFRRIKMLKQDAVFFLTVF